MGCVRAWRGVQEPAKTVMCVAKETRYRFVRNNPAFRVRSGIPRSLAPPTKSAKTDVAKERVVVRLLAKKMKSAAIKILCNLAKIPGMDAIAGERLRRVRRESCAKAVSARSLV